MLTDVAVRPMQVALFAPPGPRLEVQTVETRLWRSAVRPEITVTRPDLLPILEWADQNPVVYQIVTGYRSKAYGIGSSEFIGWAQRSDDPRAVWARVHTLHNHAHDTWSGQGMWGWKANYTLTHYRDKGFTGGFFFCSNGGDHQGLCMTLDYTPQTVFEVARRFAQWAGEPWHRTRWVVLQSKSKSKGRKELQRWAWGELMQVIEAEG